MTSLLAAISPKSVAAVVADATVLAAVGLENFGDASGEKAAALVAAARSART